MKGVGHKADEQKRIIVQAVGARVDMDYGGSWKENEDRRNTMVFIGKDIDSLHIDQLLNELLYINTDKVS
ncbi:GTP-binding protein [Sphingobacterium sp. DN00404]|uniref:GTP-binding protein n=2 Tax=Sphingobacterium micropteri TaxID=2763501 RepID=A0ABR7YNV1_9SPHI|nr:GTP-binding protein [Sphingobacterium micropteri]